MTTERKARSEARNRLMSLGIGLLFIGSVVQLRAADLVSQRTLKEIRAHPPIPIEMAVPADGESGIIAYLRGLKKMSAGHIPGEL